MRRHPASRAAAVFRIFGRGEDPLTWSFGLARLGGIVISAHLLLPAWIIVELLNSLRTDRMGPIHVGPAVCGFCLAAGIREVMRIALCRRAGVGLERVALWPLGSFAIVLPSRHASPGGETVARLGAQAGIHGSLCWTAILACGVALISDVERLLFHPFRPAFAVMEIRTPLGIWVWWAYYASAMVLVFNLLVLGSPTDLGRAAEAWLSKVVGRRRASLRVAQCGVAVGAVLTLLAMAMDETRAMGVAAVVGVASFLDLRRARFLDAPVLHPASTPQSRPRHEPRVQPADEERMPDRTPERTPSSHPPADTPQDRSKPPNSASDDEAELDRILAKIHATGLDSLSGGERRILEAATARRRRE